MPNFVRIAYLYLIHPTSEGASLKRVKVGYAEFDRTAFFKEPTIQGWLSRQGALPGYCRQQLPGQRFETPGVDRLTSTVWLDLIDRCDDGILSMRLLCLPQQDIE